MAIDKQTQVKTYQGTFFSKLAERGVVPTTEEEAQSLLKMASQTRVIRDAQVRRQSAATSQHIKAASANLDRILNGDIVLDRLTERMRRGRRRN